MAGGPLHVAEHILRSALLQIPILRQDGPWHAPLRIWWPEALPLFEFYPPRGILQTEEEKIIIRTVKWHDKYIFFFNSIYAGWLFSP